MSCTVFIKSSNIENISKFLIDKHSFVFKENVKSQIILELDKHLRFELNDVKDINEYTMNFLDQNDLEDSTIFYQVVNMDKFDIEISIYLLNSVLSLSGYIEFLKELFCSLSDRLQTEVILNFSEKDFSLFKKGKLELSLIDNRSM